MVGVVLLFTSPSAIGLLLLTDYSNPNQIAFTAGFVTQLLVPYLLLLIRPQRRTALAPRIIAFRLSMHRRLRILHPRDLYAVDWNNSTKARRRRVRQAGLRRNRPRFGPASKRDDGKWDAAFRMYARKK